LEQQAASSHFPKKEMEMEFQEDQELEDLMAKEDLQDQLG